MRNKKIVTIILSALILLAIVSGTYLYLSRQRFKQATPFGYDALGCECKGLKVGEYCYGKVHDCKPAEIMPIDY